MADINATSLRKLGFASSDNFGRPKSKQCLNWRGARLWWDGDALMYEGRLLEVDSIDSLVAFIKSLGIKRRPGVKVL